MSEDAHDSNNPKPVKRIQYTFLSGRGEPFDDIMSVASDVDGNLLPVYMMTDGEDILYYSNEPFTMDEAVALHSIPTGDED